MIPLILNRNIYSHYHQSKLNLKSYSCVVSLTVLLVKGKQIMQEISLKRKYHGPDIRRCQPKN